MSESSTQHNQLYKVSSSALECSAANWTSGTATSVQPANPEVTPSQIIMLTTIILLKNLPIDSQRTQVCADLLSQSNLFFSCS